MRTSSWIVALGLGTRRMVPGDASERKRGKRPDAELVRAALARDELAVRRFVERMRCVPRILYAMSARMGRPLRDEELEDLAQETVTAVWRKLDRYDGTASLETWVYRFCHFELVRRLRGRRRRPVLLADDLEGSSYEPEAPEETSAVEHEHVLRGLERLEEELAELLHLKHYEDLTFEQIGERLGIPTNTAKTRYYRALRKLRRVLAGTKEEPSGSKRT